MRTTTILTTAALLLASGTAAVAAEATPTARTIADTCVGDQSSGFSDVPDSGGVHAPRIRCIGPNGFQITEGFPDGTYRPADQVTGIQIAAFLNRTLRAADALDEATTSTTCGGGPLQIEVGILVDNDVMDDCDKAAPATRAEMALWTSEAMRLLAGIYDNAAPDFFDDDNALTDYRQARINSLAAYGVVTGTGNARFAPEDSLSRGEMGTFLARTLDTILNGGTQPEAGPAPVNTANPGDVVVTTVREDGPGNDVEQFGDSEYLELSNTTNATISVGGFTVVDLADNFVEIPAGYTIPAGGTLRIYSGDGNSDADTWYANRDQAWLNNSGDTIRVFDGAGTVLDTFSY